MCDCANNPFVGPLFQRGSGGSSDSISACDSPPRSIRNSTTLMVSSTAFQKQHDGDQWSELSKIDLFFLTLLFLFGCLMFLKRWCVKWNFLFVNHFLFEYMTPRLKRFSPPKELGGREVGACSSSSLPSGARHWNSTAPFRWHNWSYLPRGSSKMTMPDILCLHIYIYICVCDIYIYAYIYT